MQISFFSEPATIFNVFCLAVLLAIVLYKRLVFNRFVIISLSSWLLFAISMKGEFSCKSDNTGKILYVDTSYSMLFTRTKAVEEAIQHLQRKIPDLQTKDFSGTSLDLTLQKPVRQFNLLRPPEAGLILTDQRADYTASGRTAVLRVASLPIDGLIFDLQIPKICYAGETCEISFKTLGKAKPVLSLNQKRQAISLVNVSAAEKKISFTMPSIARPMNFFAELCLEKCNGKYPEISGMPARVPFILRAERLLPLGAIVSTPLDLYAYKVMRQLSQLAGLKIEAVTGMREVQKSKKYNFVICVSETQTSCPGAKINLPTYVISGVPGSGKENQKYLFIKPDAEIFSPDANQSQLQNFLKISDQEFEGFLSGIPEMGGELRYRGVKPPSISDFEKNTLGAVKSVEQGYDYFYRIASLTTLQWEKNVLSVDIDSAERNSLAIQPGKLAGHTLGEIESMAGAYFSKMTAETRTLQNYQVPFALQFSSLKDVVLWPGLLFLIFSVLFFWYGNVYRKI